MRTGAVCRIMASESWTRWPTMLHPRAHADDDRLLRRRAALGYVEAIKGLNHRGVSLEFESLRATTNRVGSGTGSA